MDGGGIGRNKRQRALRWETATAVAEQWMGSGGGAIKMHGIEIAVDGGGGDGQRRRNGRQDGRVAVAWQRDGVSPPSRC